MQGKRVQHWVEWARGWGRGTHGVDRAASKALPQHLILQPLHPAHTNSTQRSKPSIKGVAVAPTGLSQPQSPRGFSHTHSAKKQCQGLSSPWREMASETPQTAGRRMHLGKRHHTRGCRTPNTLCPCAVGMDPTKHRKAPQGLSPTQGHSHPWLAQKCVLADNFQLPARRLLCTQTLALGAGKSPPSQPRPNPVIQRPGGWRDSLRADADGGVQPHR